MAKVCQIIRIWQAIKQYDLLCVWQRLWHTHLHTLTSLQSIKRIYFHLTFEIMTIWFPTTFTECIWWMGKLFVFVPTIVCKENVITKITGKNKPNSWFHLNNEKVWKEFIFLIDKLFFYCPRSCRKCKWRILKYFFKVVKTYFLKKATTFMLRFVTKRENVKKHCFFLLAYLNLD